MEAQKEIPAVSRDLEPTIVETIDKKAKDKLRIRVVEKLL